MNDRKAGWPGRPEIVPAVLGVLLLVPALFPFALMGREAFCALRDTVHGEVARGLPGVLLGVWIAVQLAVAVGLLVRACRLARLRRRG